MINTTFVGKILSKKNDEKFLNETFFLFWVKLLLKLCDLPNVHYLSMKLKRQKKTFRSTFLPEKFYSYYNKVNVRVWNQICWWIFSVSNLFFVWIVNGDSNQVNELFGCEKFQQIWPKFGFPFISSHQIILNKQQIHFWSSFCLKKH